jgi:hypothetical protein
VLDRVASGALTVADIRNGPPATRALIIGAEARQPVVSSFGAGVTLLDALADLRRLGWLDDTARCNASAVTDAVVGLVERALALGLRPR